MGLKNSKRKYAISKENRNRLSRALSREIIPTYTQYRAKKTRSASKIVEENGGQQITVTGSPNVGYNGDYDLYVLDNAQFYYKHALSTRYIYKSVHNVWFMSKVLNSSSPEFWTKTSTPDPSIPALWYHWKQGKSVPLGDDFKLQRFFKIDPPTPTTQRKIKTSSQTSITAGSTQILIFPAFSVVPSWEDEEFKVSAKGSNNFQDASNKTMRVHLSLADWTWSTQWDGPIFFPVNDFFIKWQNREYIVKMPFVSNNNGCNVNDVQQGNVGDCWFLSSVMTVINFGQGLIQNVICLEENQNSKDGGYKFRFYHFDKWEEVIVDGYLPLCGTARSAYYATIKDLFDRFHKKQLDENQETDYWVPLLEKAFAKYCGSYRTLVAGHPTRGLSYLTGGMAIRMPLEKSQIQNFEAQKYNFFSYLLNNYQRICCCTSTMMRPDQSREKEHEVVAPNGLVYNHAYSLLTALTVTTKKGKTVNMLKIRNPWNKRTNSKLSAEWKGDWSRQSKLWKTLDDEDRAGMAFDEGEFWMAYRDWTKFFRVIDICYPPSYFENFSRISFQYSRKIGSDASYWAAGMHGRHSQPSHAYPVAVLVELNKAQGFATYSFVIREGTSEVFVQNLCSIKYIDRLSWLRTLVMFDETQNKFLTPLLGSDHDLISANDTAIYRLAHSDEGSTNGQRKMVLQIKLSAKEEAAPSYLEFITRIFVRTTVEHCPSTDQPVH